MTTTLLHTILRMSEGKTYSFSFADGTEMLANVVSATHVDADDSIVIIRVGAGASEPAWQIRLADIRSVCQQTGP
jgi:hypothetical protein